VLIDHVGKITVRNEIYCINLLRHEIKFNPVLDLHVIVVDTDIVPVSVVFINIDVVAHPADDFKIHFLEVVTVDQRVIDFLGKCRKRTEAKKKDNKCLFHVDSFHPKITSTQRNYFLKQT
jgi:hypothetical protein